MTQLDWQQIDTLLLDMDGTLLDLRFDNYFWREYIPQVYAKQKNIAVAEAEQKIKAWYSEKAGTLDWYCIDYWSERLQLDIAEHKQLLAEHIAVRPSVDRFLQRVHQDKQIEVCLATNAHQTTLSIKLEKTGIAPYFDHIVSSHQFGEPKESQAFWCEIQSHIGFDPARALFIDDSLPILRSAKEYGIGFTCGIALPDSEGTQVSSDEFELIASFDQLF